MENRIVLIILDGVGIGEMEDSYQYGDEGSNSLRNTAEAMGGLKLHTMQKLGLGNIEEIRGVSPVVSPLGAYGKMAEKSAGKDSTTGHWEMMGLVLDQPFPTYPQGFPLDLIQEYERAIGRKTLGNIVASGTTIINELGDEHVKTGFPIIYTSADSVFQIAAHEDIVPLEQLYDMCRTARFMLTGEHAVGRVIARPFTGFSGNYTRTFNRHDYSLEPDKNVLDYLIDAGKQVIGIGKIIDLFAGRGISDSRPTKSNQEGINRIIEAVQDGEGDLIFANLLDFDQLFGHRNNVIGYAHALEEFDNHLPDIIKAMHPGDILIISADHGNDPTTPSTDHSREYVPLLVYGENIRNGVNLGVRSSFADVGQTVIEYLGIADGHLSGYSFYDLIKE